MKRVMISEGVYVYEQEQADLTQTALMTLARMQAAELPDDAAVQVAALFPLWQAGASYEMGQRIADEAGNLYRVVQTHTAQSDWQVSETPNLYTPLGVTAQEPDAIPEWVQPVGGHDAYAAGAQVRYEGVVYKSLIEANIYPPNTEFWAVVE